MGIGSATKNEAFNRPGQWVPPPQHTHTASPGTLSSSSELTTDSASQPPSSSANWFWDYAIGFYLLEFLLWISTFLPGLVGWINRFFFWLLFNGKKENCNLSHKIFNYECRFKQHVQDWAIPREKTKVALLELKATLEANPKVVAHYPVEVRFTRADDILLSPCFQRDSCYMNIIMYRPYGKDVPRLDYWLAYENIMKKVGGRPHWAKAHNCTRKDFEKMYPAFQRFCAIREKLDPTGMFLNAYLEKGKAQCPAVLMGNRHLPWGPLPGHPQLLRPTARNLVLGIPYLFILAAPRVRKSTKSLYLSSSIPLAQAYSHHILFPRDREAPKRSVCL
ncbi:hypothetical protein MJG53_003551 [Ovis ammon polii x Ovis aries]|uniref:Uncharacterized protein n=1 Tax=Ovis ammon polii x Ovis aries TaxID=2918886 RepID=A0ACB9VH41_9CETA|nr:hypothetical protein MJG53_003551 [Ovis ammon polii x Ovis aries]